MELFDSIEEVATHLRIKLEDKKTVLLFAYNGIGKTRLSMAFRKQGRQNGQGDTLYFNAFTEDLFTWDNDLENDSEYKLKLNMGSKFFDGLKDGLITEDSIRRVLRRYVDFDFRIDTNEWAIRFFREAHHSENPERPYNIKVSRGEENIFIWCFFLAIVELAMDDETEAYSWVRHIYIDDPISSLDENNAVAVGHFLAQLLKRDHPLKTVISSHHTLFFNVLSNELSRADKYFLSKNKASNKYYLKDTSNTPFFYHVAMLAELRKAADRDELYTYHFNILRSILEKAATFHGFDHFSDCIKQREDDPDGILHTRIINILNHGNYSLFEPQEMQQESKDYLRRVLEDFMQNYQFNPVLFTESTGETST